jgi:hypothetical protein
MKDRIASRPNMNSYTAWNEAGKEQTSLVNTIFAVNCHTIATMRSKMEYTMQTDEKGKQKPVKLRLAPVQRDDTEYEFDIVLDIGRDHIATASKDVTFLDRFGQIITPELGKQLAAWLNDGAELPTCSVCHTIIRDAEGKSAAQIVAGTKKNAGAVMCLPCFKQFLADEKAAREAASGNP